MAKVLFYTLGNSDIHFYTKEAKQRPRNFKEITQELYHQLEKDNLEINEENLSFKPHVDSLLIEVEVAKNTTETQIISSIDFPILTNLLKILNKSSNRPNKIYFFYTQQENSEHTKQDTYFLAQLIQIWLIKTKGYQEKDICLEKISKNPSDHDVMAQFFYGWVKTHLEELKYYSHVFSQLTAGTPAMILGLSFALTGFGLNPLVYYQPYQQEPKKVDFFNKAQKEKEEEILISFLNSMNYKGALTFFISSVFKNNSIFESHIIEKLIKAALELKNFNFKEAYNALISFRQHPDLKKIIEILSNIIINQDDNKKIEFLLFLIEQSLKQDELLEVVAFISALSDILLKNAVEKITDIKIQKENKEFKQWNDFLEKKHPNLHSEGKNNTSKPMMHKVLKEYPKKAEDILNLNQNFIQISEKRNQTPLAHGLKGITTEDKKLLQDTTQKIKGYLGVEEINTNNVLFLIEKKIKCYLKGKKQ